MASSWFLDVDSTPDLYPLNVLRAEETLHFGVRPVAKQWQDVLQTKPHLRVHPRLLPTAANIAALEALSSGDSWVHEGVTVAQLGAAGGPERCDVTPDMWTDVAALFERAGDGLREDLARLKRAWRLRTLDEDEREAWATRGVIVHGPMDRIHVAPGAVLRDATFNTEQGDVVLGPGAEVMEGCRIRAPFALGEGSTLRMGSLVYGPTAVGQGCKVGGELSNVVVHDWSNKAHGGFLGNSVLGSWCNLGAETTCSNLKNTYGEIAEWSAADGSFQGRGRTFCGLIMGDHSKTAIHTAFSTATVVGVMCNVFGDGTPPRHVPPFSWGIEGETYDVERALETARKVMARRSQGLTTEDETRIRAAFEASIAP